MGRNPSSGYAIRGTGYGGSPGLEDGIKSTNNFGDPHGGRSFSKRGSCIAAGCVYINIHTEEYSTAILIFKIRTLCQAQTGGSRRTILESA